MIKTLCVFAALWSFSFPVAAQTGHNHDHTPGDDHSHSRDFGALTDGWLALESVSAEIQAAVSAENMDALHELSDELYAVADGLANHDDDVPQVNRLRFTSSINQIRSLSDRLHAAHDSNDLAAAQRLVPQINGMIQLLMVSAE